MTKRESKSVCELKKKWAEEKAQATRKARQEHFADVLEKNKLDTTEDFYNLLHGLSKKAVYRVAWYMPMNLDTGGHSPQEIVEFLEGRLK